MGRDNSLSMSVLLGLVAALCWSTHDLLARRFSANLGPFRMSFWIMVAGALLLGPVVLWRGQMFTGETDAVLMALAMGIVYAFALGALLYAFSIAPVSIVGPLTAGYPALVVIWGMWQGRVPPAWQWCAIALILTGVVIVSRSVHADEGADAVPAGSILRVIVAALIADFAFAATVIMGQVATEGLGEYEVTFLSRFPAAAVLLALMLNERTHLQSLPRIAAVPILAMAACDVTAVTAINAATWFPNRELGAMAISSYGALSVLMAMLFLRERVALRQWAGIIAVVIGVGMLGWPA
jgi:drug/metabolite transporter (DMT)-like permease